MVSNNKKQYLTDREVAEFLGLSVAALRARRLQGRPPVYVRFGRSVRYAIADLESWAEVNRVEAIR